MKLPAPSHAPALRSVPIADSGASRQPKIPDSSQSAATASPDPAALLSPAQEKLKDVSHEHIDWDQATVRVQLGLLDASRLPVAGRESAAQVRDPSLPANQLIQRAAGTPKQDVK